MKGRAIHLKGATPQLCSGRQHIVMISKGFGIFTMGKLCKTYGVWTGDFDAFLYLFFSPRSFSNWRQKAKTFGPWRGSRCMREARGFATTYKGGGGLPHRRPRGEDGEIGGYADSRPGGEWVFFCFFFFSGLTVAQNGGKTGGEGGTTEQIDFGSLTRKEGSGTKEGNGEDGEGERRGKAMDADVLRFTESDSLANQMSEH